MKEEISLCKEMRIDVKRLRHSKEKPLFILLSVLSMMVFVFIFTASFFQTELHEMVVESTVEEYKYENGNVESLSDSEILLKLEPEEKELIELIEGLDTTLIAFFPVFLFLLFLFSYGNSYGQVRGDAVKVGEHQFPKLYSHWRELSNQFGFKNVPELYMMNGNGNLNAYATCLPGYRRYGVVFSDIVEKGLESGEMETVRFILGHELGHIRLGHVYWWYMLLTYLGNLPGLNYIIGLPLSRAREYSCDKIGYALSDDKECRSLMMLAVGKHHFQQVNTEAYHRDHVCIGGFWETVYNFLNTHPNTNWRIAALKNEQDGPLCYKRKKR